MAGKRRRDRDSRPEPTRDQRDRVFAASRTQECERRETGDRDREHCSDEPDTTELRFEHIPDQGGAERGIQPEPARVRALETDPGDRHNRQQHRGHRKRRPQRPAHHRRLRSQHKRQDARPADAEQDEREVEEPNDIEAPVNRPRAALILQNLTRNTSGPGARLADMEDKRTTDRMRVRRHDPPRDRVGPPRQARPKPDGDLPRLWPGRPAIVDAASCTVVHPHGAKRRLDRLAEAQHNTLRSTGQHLVAGGNRRHKLRMRPRRRSSRQRGDHSHRHRHADAQH